MTASHDSDAWRELVDPEALAGWMNAQGLGDGPLERIAPIGGGTQNVMLSFTRSGRSYVFRRPPRNLRPESNDAMVREMQILQALSNTEVPHPAFIAGCSDPAVLNAAFYLMEPVDGFNATIAMPSPHADDAGLRREMGEALVDGIIALSRVPINTPGLDTLGKLEGWLERQVPRWQRQLDSYAAFTEWSGLDALPDVGAICAWLEANRPAAMKPGLVHGDYHMANVIFRDDGPGLAAIVDWELGSRGDPLLDLGWLIATWPDGQSEATVPVEPWDGFPTIEEVVDRYLAATGRSAADARWFGVLACFKLGVLLEGTHARATAGLAPKAIGDRLHRQTIALFRRAHRAIAL